MHALPVELRGEGSGPEAGRTTIGGAGGEEPRSPRATAGVALKGRATEVRVEEELVLQIE